MLALMRSEEVAAWVGQRLACSFHPPWQAVGFIDEEGGPLRGGVVVHDWNGANAELTIVTDRPPSRGEVRGLYSYVFDQLQARRVTFRTHAANLPAIRFLEKRATLEALLVDWFPSGAALQFAIRREDPRWQHWKVSS